MSELTPTRFVDDILSACDPSNWDAERNKGDYYKGLRDAYEHIHEIAAEYQTAMYRSAALAQEREECAKVAEAQAEIFLSPKYATGQPDSSFAERFACSQIAAAIRSRGQG